MLHRLSVFALALVCFAHQSCTAQTLPPKAPVNDSQAWRQRATNDVFDLYKRVNSLEHSATSASASIFDLFKRVSSLEHPTATASVDMPRVVIADLPDVIWFNQGVIDPEHHGRFERPDLLFADISARLPDPSGYRGYLIADVEGGWTASPTELIAASDQMIKLVRYLKAVCPNAKAGIYDLTLPTCNGPASEAQWRGAFATLEDVFAVVDALFPCVYDGDPDPADDIANRLCIKRQVVFALDHAHGKPVLAVVGARYYSPAAGDKYLALIPDAELVADVGTIFDAHMVLSVGPVATVDSADGVVYWRSDTYYNGLATQADATEAAVAVDQRAARKVFASEIPPGVDPSKWLAWVDEKTKCLLRRAALADTTCMVPAMPIPSITHIGPPP